jgi:hypothetical protein
MPDDTEYDPTDKGTLRPKAKPLTKKGDIFYPMKLPDFHHEIQLPEDVSPDDPITLFTMYYTPRIIDWIVEKTNSYDREFDEDAGPYARGKDWYPTCPGEIYTYFAIRVYMTLYVQNEISDYWDTKDYTPDHFITKKMRRDRFQELHIRVRLAGSQASGPYQKASFTQLILNLCTN